MPPADASNPLAALLASLRRTGLLTPEALAEVEARPDAQGTDPKPLGRHLFQQGLVTRYQLNQLATGRDDDLIPVEVAVTVSVSVQNIGSNLESEPFVHVDCGLYPLLHEVVRPVRVEDRVA